MTHPANRPHKVDKATGDFLFDLYQLLFSSNVSLRIKQRTLETAAESQDSWRVVSITHAALEHIAKNGSAKGLQRAHVLSRVDRASHLFERKQPLTQPELLEYFFEHDTSALVTKAENAKDGTKHWSTLRAVPAGLFPSPSLFKVSMRKKTELPWVIDQLELAKPNVP